MSQAEEIFASALEISNETEREAMLQRLCAGSLQLRAHIDELLAVHAQADQFFSNCMTGVSALTNGSPASQRFAEGTDHNVGLRIGHYKLLQKIGEGGCGGVYMAEQEKPVRRRVALKIIKLGMDTRNVIARFESERQALAM